MLCIRMHINYIVLNLKIFYIFGVSGSPFADAVFKTDCIKNQYMFQCTDDIIVVLNTASAKGEPI